MRSVALLSLLTLATALPTALTGSDQENSLSVSSRDVATVEARAPEQPPAHVPALVARALLDRTDTWPATSADYGTYSFQIRLEKQSNGNYLLTWWNTDAANSWRNIKLTLNAGDGTRIYDLVTSPQTRGTTTITPRTSTFRAIFDEQ